MNILIAYDGSEQANAAMNDLSLAGLPPHANALVLSVVDAWLPSDGPLGGRAEQTLPGLKDICTAVEQRVTAQREMAERAAARLRTIFPGWRVQSDACTDAPAAAIVRRAEGKLGGVCGHPADLTVVGSRGLGPIKRVLVGSVAQKVMHTLRGSLRISRGRVAVEPGADGLSWHPPRIVVGVDGSADSDAAVAAVAARSWPVDTRVLVACYAQGIEGIEHSNALVASGYSGGGIWSDDSQNTDGPVHSVASQTVARAAGIIRERCPAVNVSTVVRLADPSYALVEDALNWGRHPDQDPSEPGKGADCIFVGSRGVRGIERFLLGSVSVAVAMNAHCSVEIVHRPPS